MPAAADTDSVVSNQSLQALEPPWQAAQRIQMCGNNAGREETRGHMSLVAALAAESMMEHKRLANKQQVELIIIHLHP